MRNSLVAALVACADRPQRLAAWRFLAGLSSDELQFIAEYLGASILGGGSCLPVCRCGHDGRVVADRELKMILVREYLCRAGVQELPFLRARHAVN